MNDTRWDDHDQAALPLAAGRSRAPPTRYGHSNSLRGEVVPSALSSADVNERSDASLGDNVHPITNEQMAA